MYSRRDIAILGKAKTQLRTRIAARRADCRAAVTTLGTPLPWIELAILAWKRAAPWLRARRETAETTRTASAPPRGTGPFRIMQWLDAIEHGINVVRLVRSEVGEWTATRSAARKSPQ